MLFSDLVDSTALASRLDPEDYRTVLGAYQETCGQAVLASGGSIVQHLGDGLLAYFGYPQADEHDPQNAVRAALAIVERVAALRPEIGSGQRIDIAARVGIHTGPAVVGEVGAGERRETLALGSTANLAARLQGVAAPGTVVLSEATMRLVRGMFRVDELGLHELKGLPEPVRVYRALGSTGAIGRLDRSSGQLTPFVARDAELRMLAAEWGRAREGRGQAIVISGEAGIGKSRLVRALRDQLAGEPHAWLECRASAYTKDSALYPVTEMIAASLGFSAGDTPATRVELLRAALAGAGVADGTALTILAELLSLPTGGLPALPPASPGRRRRQLFDSLVEFALGLARSQPIALIFEDLHWLDPSSLEWIQRIVDKVRGVPVLVVMTHRPGFSHPCTAGEDVLVLPLDRLGPEESREVVRSVVGRALPPGVVARIAERSDGVPLFLEELSQSVVASAAARSDLTLEQLDHIIPEALQDSLMSRLDALRGAKETAQLCACLGREFSFALAAAVSPLDEAELRGALEGLVGARLLFRTRAERETYVFKHALIQEAAYQSMLRRRRQEAHHEIADVLVRDFPEVKAAQPELIAHHYTEAAEAEPAVTYWRLAGRRAVQRFAYLEAAQQLRKALAVLPGMPDPAAAAKLELEIQMSLGMVLSSTSGYGAREVRTTFARASELCERIGETHEIFPALFGLWLFHMAQADNERMEQYASQLLALAEKVGDSGMRLEAEQAMGVSAYWGGQLERALRHFSRVPELYDPAQHGSHALIFGHDPCVMALAIAGSALWLLGHPDAAVESHERAQALAARIAHPFTQAACTAFYAGMRNLRREPEHALALGLRQLQMCEEQGFDLYAAGACGGIGNALIEQGHVEEGIARAQESCRRYKANGSRVGYLTPLLAIARGRLLQGDAAAGLEAIEEAHEVIRSGLDRIIWPEVHRLEAELRLLRDPKDTAAAEAGLRRALALAEASGARGYALRAATSLAGLLRASGGREEGLALLRPLYAAYREGLDTPDLVAARERLEALAA